MTAAAGGDEGRAHGKGGSAAPEAAAFGGAVSIAAGLLTSALYTSATYPVHRVKILLQTQDANPAILSGRVKRYAFTQAFARLLREQGVAGLWRGNTPYLLRHVPSVAMSFTFKDAIRQALLPQVSSSGAVLAVNAAAGGAAGALALAIVYPFEFATVRMAADLGSSGERQYGSTMQAAWLQAVQREGLLATYRGFGLAVASTAVYKGLYFGLYDSAKARFLGSDDAAPAAVSPTGFALRSALAVGTTYVSATLAYPLDVIRKRLIVDTAADERLYGSSFRGAVREIYLREGLRGFYRFYAYDMAFRVFAGGILVGYDVFLELLGAPGGRRQGKEAPDPALPPVGVSAAVPDGAVRS